MSGIARPRRSRAAVEVVAHERADGAGVEERLAAHRRPAGVHEVAVGRRLEHVAGGAGPQRLEEELLVLVHRQHQHAQLGPAVVSSRAACRPVMRGMRHVEDREVDVVARAPAAPPRRRRRPRRRRGSPPRRRAGRAGRAARSGGRPRAARAVTRGVRHATSLRGQVQPDLGAVRLGAGPIVSVGRRRAGRARACRGCRSTARSTSAGSPMPSSRTTSRHRRRRRRAERQLERARARRAGRRSSTPPARPGR